MRVTAADHRIWRRGRFLAGSIEDLMATEGTEAVPTRPGDAGSRRSKTHRRILFCTIASLVVAVTVVGSVLLLARTSTTATIATQPSMTPLASAATAMPSASGPAGSAATATPATPSVAPATPSAVPTALPTPTVQEYTSDAADEE